MQTTAQTQLHSQRPPAISIALLSATALAYEILLTRLFSIIQWHHFAYMIISIALLGYGASGAFLSYTQTRLLKRYSLAYLSNLMLFGISIVPCFLLAQQIPFNPEEVLWDIRQPLRLLLLYLLLTLPFFFAANAIALTLANYRHSISRIYGLDLMGAGIGSLGIILLLLFYFPLDALTALGILGLCTVAVAAWELRARKRLWLSLGILVMLVPVVVINSGASLNISPYKGLQQTLSITGSHIIAERSSPLGLIQVVANPDVPLRHAPGLSLNATQEPPLQLGVFTDADGMSVITQDIGDPQAFAYLDQLTNALPYHLYKPNHVLILGAGGGSDIQLARYHNVMQIEAVELNPQIITLLQRDYAKFSGGLFNKKEVQIHTAEARSFIEQSSTRFDLIQIALLDSFSASSAGLYALNENYLYTTEALQAYLRRLNPNGFLAISRWIKLPPRDTLKLFATAVAALRQSGIEDAQRRLMLIRGWQTSTLLIKNGVVAEREIAALRDFSQARAFDVAYYPGMPADEANQYNILRQAYFYQAARALLGTGQEDFLTQYKFNLQPATDDRPYFFNFFKWSVLPEIINLRGRGGTPLLESGYLILVATLLQAVLASMVLIVLPLLFLRRKTQHPSTQVSRVRILAYFFAIGLAFLFIEMAFIQKFILFLHHPLYAVAVVVSAFLIFAGLGSTWSKRLTERRYYRRGVILAVVGIAALSILYIFMLGPLFSVLAALPIIIKIIVSLLLIAPLAFCMGLPFPLAMTRLGEDAVSLLPWAWGINGCASVISAVLATLLAIHFGFTLVVLAALVLYSIAAGVFPLSRHEVI